jgi:hypothetical protein
MKSLRILLLTLATGLSAAAATARLEAAPGHEQAHSSTYAVYWRRDASSHWVSYSATYPTHAAAHKAATWLARAYRVQTYIVRHGR